MKITSGRRYLSLLALFLGSLDLHAAEAPTELMTVATKMFEAIDKEVYEQFVADGDNAWRRLQRSEFDRLASQLRPKLKGGYEVLYLGQIKRIDGVQQTLWKLTLKSNGEELLANIDMKDGKVARFGVPRI